MRRPEHWRVIIAIVLSLTATRAEAQKAEPRRMVFWVEASGTEVGVVRVRLREAIPDSVLPLDGVDFRATMTQRGQRGPLRANLGTAKERTALFERIRASARDLRAEGVVYVSLKEVRRRRLLRVIVLWANEEAPALDQVVALERAAANTDGAKMKAVLAPVFERLAPPAEPSPPPPVSAAPPSIVETPIESPAPPISRPVDAPPAGPPPPIRDRPRVSGGVTFDFFPAGFAPNYANAKVAIPFSKSFAIVPRLGGGYIPEPADDYGPIFGGGIRITPGTWTIEPNGYYASFPKFVNWYQAGLRIGTAFGPADVPTLKLTLAASATRWVWRRGLGAPGSELIEGFGELEAEARPRQRLFLAAQGGYFVYDRSLAQSKAAINAVAFALAPYPLLTFFGGTIGYDTGRWMPYLGARYFVYSADIGTGVLVGPGLRMTSGADFVDARVGFIASSTSGPLSNSVLDAFPVVHLDSGFTF
jgi:hypothetical protein